MSVPSCSCDLAALTHGLSVCATVFISCDKLDECHVPEDKTACSFVCGLPHLCSVRVSIPAVMGVVWLVLTRLDLSRLASSTYISRFVSC